MRFDRIRLIAGLTAGATAVLFGGPALASAQTINVAGTWTLTVTRRMW